MARNRCQFNLATVVDRISSLFTTFQQGNLLVALSVLETVGVRAALALLRMALSDTALILPCISAMHLSRFHD